jgi:hypothetical protein
MSHRAAENPAKYVSASFVRREHTVGEKKCDCARVISNDAECRGLDEDSTAFLYGS